MSGFRYLFSVCLLLSLLATGLVPGLTQGEDDGGCADFMAAVPATVASLYADMAPGQVGYISAAHDAPAEVSGGLRALADLDMVQIGVTPDTWDLAVLQPVADVTMVLLGGKMVNATPADATLLPTVTVTSTARPNLNLRDGPGTNYPALDTLPFDELAIADGRNATGDWLRLQRDDLTVWGFAEYLEPDGDLETLSTLADDDRSRPGLYTAPMQAFTLTTAFGISVCEGAGLLVQRVGGDEENPEVTHLQINGVRLAFTGATLLVQAETEDALQIAVIDGGVRVTAPGNAPVTAESEALVTVEPGLAPAAASAYPLATVAGVSFDLLPAPDRFACIVGLEPDADAVTMHAGPGTRYVRLTTSLTADAHYRATGYATDVDDAAWWQLDVPGRAQAWAPQEAVSTLGSCGAVEAVEAPPVVAAPPASFVPPGQSVWQSYPGADNMSGTCNGPAIPLCDHLVAITASPESISWRGQEPTAYAMAATGPNTFVYNGRRIQGDGNLSMSLTFTSATTWSMTMVLVYDNDPECRHTFYYTATFNW